MAGQVTLIFLLKSVVCDITGNDKILGNEREGSWGLNGAVHA